MKRKIYLASSWKNENPVIAELMYKMATAVLPGLATMVDVLEIQR